MPISAHIAIDLGAESGRVMLGILENQRLRLKEVHRFTHLPVPTPAGMVWDITGLWRAILDGIRETARVAVAQNLRVQSVGVDTWGVDFTLVSPAGTLLGLPMCYRDAAFPPAFAKVLQRVPRRAIYEATGIQLMPINTLFQFEHRFRADPKVFDSAAAMLFMPDLFHFLLSGKVTVERTIASTSQMVDARSGEWSTPLLRQLGLPTQILPDMINPATVIGPVRPELARMLGLPADTQVVAPPAHDTAAAVAATPARIDSRWCYLSSGTWSLLGAELDRPCITDASAEANFTNELGVGGTVRFLKNIAGLWLVQECRRQWERQGKPADYTELTRQALQAPRLQTLIPVNDPAFAAPGDMVDRIRNYARASHQIVPATPGEIVRGILESLALEYRATLLKLQQLLDKKFDTLHIIGGGGKNDLLNQMTADATGAEVIVGPHEATATGNILTQAMGMNAVRDLWHLRQIVAADANVKKFRPGAAQPWTDAAERYAKLPAVPV